MDKTTLDWKTFKSKNKAQAEIAENSRNSQDYLNKLEFSRKVAATRAEAARLARIEEREQREKLLTKWVFNNVNLKSLDSIVV